MAGIAGLDFIDDIIKQINSEWIINSGGRKPEVSKIWKTKEIGLVNTKDERIIVSLDNETPQVFGLRYTVNNKTTYDWMHNVSVSIDIWTGVSEARILQMVDEVMRILKANVLLKVGNNQYVQMLPTGITSLNEQYRNMFRYMIDVEVMKFNP